MSENKPQWTPGEWFTRPMTPGEPDKSWEVVTRLHHQDGEDLGETAVAIYLTRGSAHLLAGARDLYAELEDAAREMEALAEDCCGTSAEEHFRPKAARYRLVLAKARGEEAPE